MRICPHCRSEFADSTLEVCPFDNWGLVTPEDYYDAEDDPLIGAEFGGRFRIVGRLGVGAMGTVYKAVQESVNRLVALKVLRPDLTNDPDTAARFHREAHATSALKHPSTVTLYDFGQTAEGYLYIAMEFLEGRLLGRLLKEKGELPINLAVRIVIQIARSLAEAHRKGIVHRDLKPDNIILAQVEGQEVVKVLDFGIAKIIRGDRQIDALETQAGTVFGTPRYMSPEQAQSKPLDARSDLYSLGVIFFHMLTGHAPFEDSDAVVVMARHIKTPPRKPSEVRPDLHFPPQLEKLVMKLMEKDRTKRPQSAEELIQNISELGRGRTDDFAIVPGRVARINRRLVPIVTATMVSFLLVVGAVIAFALTYSSHTSPFSEENIEHQSASVLQPARSQGEVRASEADDAARMQVAAAKIEFTVDSEPSGAVVRRDGAEIGTTPLQLHESSGTKVPLQFFLRGYRTISEVVTINSDDTSYVVTLSPLRHSKARPVQATVERETIQLKNVDEPPPVRIEKAPPTPREKRSRYGMFDRGR